MLQMKVRGGGGGGGGGGRERERESVGERVSFSSLCVDQQFSLSVSPLFCNLVPSSVCLTRAFRWAYQRSISMVTVTTFGYLLSLRSVRPASGFGRGCCGWCVLMFTVQLMLGWVELVGVHSVFGGRSSFWAPYPVWRSLSVGVPVWRWVCGHPIWYFRFIWACVCPFNIWVQLSSFVRLTFTFSCACERPFYV